MLYHCSVNVTYTYLNEKEEYSDGLAMYVISDNSSIHLSRQLSEKANDRCSLVDFSFYINKDLIIKEEITDSYYLCKQREYNEQREIITTTEIVIKEVSEQLLFM